MKATTRRGGAMGALPAAKKKRRKKAPSRGVMCGCGGARSVSVCTVYRDVNVSAATPTPIKKGTPTAGSPGKPASSAAKTTGCRDADADDEGTPSVDSLLRQLRDLERGVRALGVREREEDGIGGSAAGATTTTARPPRRHTRSATSVVGRLDSESVAVVTDSADPLGDFRRSMAQMIAEHGITGGAELRELLRRFLALNAACHHHLILRAFADVWEELFGGGGGHAAPVPPPAAAEKASQSHGSSSSRGSKRPRSRADTLS